MQSINISKLDFYISSNTHIAWFCNLFNCKAIFFDKYELCGQFDTYRALDHLLSLEAIYYAILFWLTILLINQIKPFSCLILNSEINGGIYFFSFSTI